MSDMENTEAINMLTEYFIDNLDSKTIAMSLARMVIDINKIYNIEYLYDDEVKDLFVRVDSNLKILMNKLKENDKYFK